MTKHVNDQAKMIQAVLDEQRAGDHQILEALRSMNESARKVKESSQSMVILNKNILNNLSALQEMKNVLSNTDLQNR